MRNDRLAPEGALREIWSSPDYHHCMFTARPGLDAEQQRLFAVALSAMNYDNPVQRAILDAEGLRRWVKPHFDCYDAPREAAGEQGFFRQLVATAD